jgi:hypothetical protein
MTSLLQGKLNRYTFMKRLSGFHTFRDKKISITPPRIQKKMASLACDTLHFGFFKAPKLLSPVSSALKTDTGSSYDGW